MIDNFTHYLGRYKEFMIDWNIIEAQKKVFNITLAYFFSKVDDILNKDKLLKIDNDSNVLFIESTNSIDWMWLWDWIFKTWAIDKLKEEWFNLSILTNENRKLIFENKWNEVIGVNWNLFDIIKTWYNIKWQFSHIISMNPSWQILLLNFICSPKKHIKHFISYDEMKKKNHIEMYWNILTKDFLYSKDIRLNTSIVLSERVRKESEGKINKIQWKFYIWINIWASSWLRHYKGWEEVISSLNKVNNNLNKVNNNLIFVLYWKDNTLWLDKQIETKFDNILNFVWKTESLYDVYWIIDQMDLNIWSDWWNINASIALGKESIVIESVVDWKLRTSKDWQNTKIVKTICEKWKCYIKNMWTKCLVTNQSCNDHEHTPPCLINISSEVVTLVEKSLKNLEN